MKKTTQVWMSIIGVILQAIAQLSPLLPDEAKHWLLVAHIILEAVLKVMAFSSNPDGTPAATAYLPGGEQQQQIDPTTRHSPKEHP